MRFFIMQEESSGNCPDFYLISVQQVIITEMYTKIFPVVAKSVAKSKPSRISDVEKRCTT
jgi:hypothetical protein